MSTLPPHDKTSEPPGARTTWARAQAGVDPDFKRHLNAKNIESIAKASMVTDANVMALRTGETLEALTGCLISFAAMSPHFDTPSHLREFAEELAKRITRDVAKARAEGYCADFIFGARKGGSA
jgi:hypothetical protein